MPASTQPKRSTTSVPVYLEVGAKKAFAAALDWPGWCRSGRSEEQALEALAAYDPRYRAVAGEAHVRFPGRADRSTEAVLATFDVVERLTGSATTDFGAPGEVPAFDRNPTEANEHRRLAKLLDASWRIFDGVVAGAPPTLRKGPRGGGRDRDKIVAHLVESQVGYARQLGIRLKPVPPGDDEAVGTQRRAILEAVRAGGDDLPKKGAWPVRYAARRLTWHVLDHAWEIEDRIE